MLFRKKEKFTSEKDLIANFAAKHLDKKYNSRDVKKLNEILEKNKINHSELEINNLIKNEIALQKQEKHKKQEKKEKEQLKIEKQKKKSAKRNRKEKRKAILSEISERKALTPEEYAKKKAEEKEFAEQQKEMRKQYAQRLEYQQKSLMEKLDSEENYVYLQNFVKKYGYDYEEYLRGAPNPKLVKYYGEKFEDFIKLMEIKGIKLSSDELKGYISLEIEIEGYNAFKSILLYDNPNNDLEKCIKNLYDAFGEENYSQYMNLFLAFLHEKEIPFDENNLDSLIKTVFKQRKAELLEQELLSDSNGANRDLNPHNLDSLTGYEFEDFLKTLFEKMGFITETTKLSGDQGADLIINNFGTKTAVQAKRYTGKVTNKAVQEVVASIAHYGADNGMVVTTGEFTASAIELANSNNIELINGQKLEELINKYY